MVDTTAVFFHSAEQKEQVDASIEKLEESERFTSPIVTRILPFTTFYEAESFHQDYYLKAPDRYDSYESNSGRDQYKAAVWQDILESEKN